MKEKEIIPNNNECIISFTDEEKKLLKKYLEEYNDMYQKILILSQKEFIEKLIKHIELSLRSKKNKYSEKSRKKVLEFLIEKIYQSDYKYAEIIQKSITKRNRYELSKNYFKGEIIPHCDKDKKNGFYVHSCGEKFQIFKYKISYDYYIMHFKNENKTKDINTNHYENILFCKKCNNIYKSSLIKFKCNETGIEFYSKISISNDENDDDLPFATWSKYHCNVVINDLMKCHKCSNNLYLLKRKVNHIDKNFIFCKKCKKIWSHTQLRWECLICKNKFSCEAKAYNPLEFKTLKICVKDAQVNKIKAFPKYLDCKCINDFSTANFFHRVSCKGELYFGELNGKKTVICNKCDSIGFYDEYVWTCPICLKKTKNILKEEKSDKKVINSKEDDKLDNKSAIHSRGGQKYDTNDNKEDKDSISYSKASKNSSYRNRRLYTLFKTNKFLKEENRRYDLKSSVSNDNFLLNKKQKNEFNEKENNYSVETRKRNDNDKKEYKTIDNEKEVNNNEEEKSINNSKKILDISKNPYEEYFKNLKQRYSTNISVNSRIKTAINENNSSSKKSNEIKTNDFKIKPKNIINSGKKYDENNKINNHINDVDENKVLKPKKSLSIIDFGFSNMKDMGNLLNKFEKKININLNLKSSIMDFHRPSNKQIIAKPYATIENKDKELVVMKNKTTINNLSTEEQQITNNHENTVEGIKRKDSFIKNFNKFKLSSNISRISSNKVIIDKNNMNQEKNNNNNDNHYALENYNKKNNFNSEINRKKDECVSFYKKSKIFQRFKILNNNANYNKIADQNKSVKKFKIKNSFKVESNDNKSMNEENKNNKNEKEIITDNYYNDNYNNKKGSNSTAADSDNATKIIYHVKNPKQSFQIRKNTLTRYTNNFNINDYKIIKKIGQGSFGQIFQIEDKYKNKLAMKKILVTSENDIKKIEHEYQILIDLNIQKSKNEPILNLVKIYGYSSKQLDPTTYVIYVLMELAITDWEKEILSRQKTKNYYSEKELMTILSSLINTFAELQKKKISHRDIKPQNILLFKNNIYKLADFGEAKELYKDLAPTNKQTLRGTELYMAPALFQALQSKKAIKYINHNPYKSDVFSFGLCSLFAATLCFESIYDVRELNNNVSIHVILEKYLIKNYSFDVINAISHMLDINETTRSDFIEMQNEFKSIGYE